MYLQPKNDRNIQNIPVKVDLADPILRSMFLTNTLTEEF